jgi:hypothetical protein
MLILTLVITSMCIGMPDVAAEPLRLMLLSGSSGRP